VASVNADRRTYVPDDHEEENKFDPKLPHRHSSQLDDEEFIDVHKSGMIDVGKAYSAEDVHNYAIQQTMSIGFLPHKEQSISEFKEQYFLELAFPTLYPFGVGGHDMRLGVLGSRKGRLDLDSYIKHCLNLWDPRFRRHYSWLFVVCDILQRHQILIKSSVRARTKVFIQNAQAIANLNNVPGATVSMYLRRG